MTGEPSDALDVGALGVRGQIANAHVLEHALAKRGHSGSSAHAPGPFQACSAERIEDSGSDRGETQMSGRWEGGRATGYREAV